MAASWSADSRLPALDEWEIKERLFLASVVRKAGLAGIDWNEAGKRMDVLCDREFGWRPWNWYAPKNCELQYNHMLDTVVGSRKDAMLCSEKEKEIENAIYEHFAEKRKAELNALIYGNQVWYKEKFLDVKLAMKRGELSQDKMWELYNEIKQKDESIRLEKMRKENQRRERKRMQELHMSFKYPEEDDEIQVCTRNSNLVVNVEKIIGTGKPVLASLSTANIPQQDPLQSSTSPLLSSLLKSPTSSNTSVTTNVGTNSVRAAAPTITSLLTSGSMPSPTQSAITLSSSIPSKHAVQILTRPIGVACSTSPHNLKSPSQSAPTLSMLLEKNKSPTQLSEPLPESSDKPTNQLQKQTLNDCNNEATPMEIDEDITVNGEETKIFQTDSDEHDANEEQQLLEVFKHIGNIDELDIDVADVINEEVDFLKDVDVEPPTDTINVAELEMKLQAYAAGSKETETLIEDTVSSSAVDKPFVNKSNKKDVFEFSDDSNDDIPLATVASFESKEKPPATEAAAGEAHAKHTSDITDQNKSDVYVIAGFPAKIVDKAKPEKIIEPVDPKAVPEANEIEGKKSTSAKESSASPPISVDKKEVPSAYVKIKETKTSVYSEIPVKLAPNEEVPFEIEKDALIASLETKATAPEEIDTKMDAAKSGSPVADTDDDSCTTDASNYTKHEDKNKYAVTPQQRRKRESDSAVRAHALRKLRDRDRSESPMIVDESTAVGKIRYSSTQTIDMIAVSPMSSERDELEGKNPKRPLLALYQALQPQKYDAFFTSLRSEPGYDEICRRPIDFQLMRKSIESGTIKSARELKNAALLMAFNAASVCEYNTEKHSTILKFKQEIHKLREFKEQKYETKKSDKPSSKRGGRKKTNH